VISDQSQNSAKLILSKSPFYVTTYAKLDFTILIKSLPLIWIQFYILGF